MEANDLFRKVKPIKSKQTMGGDNSDILRTVGIQCGPSTTCIPLQYEADRKRDSGPLGSPSQTFVVNKLAFAIIQRPEASQEIQRQSPKNK